MRSTQIIEMEKLSAIQPLRPRRETKNTIQAEKFSCLPRESQAEHAHKERTEKGKICKRKQADDT